MAITEAAVDDPITAELWNEIAGYVNGTTGYDDIPGRFYRFDDASTYSVVAGNVDATNGLAFQAQYGTPGSETILAQISKAEGLYAHTHLTLKQQVGMPSAPTGALRLVNDGGTLKVQYPGSTVGIEAITAASLAAARAGKNRLVNADSLWATITSSQTTDNAYGVDGCRLLLGAANAATMAQDTSSQPSGGQITSISFTVGSANNNKFGGFWPVEAARMWDMRGGLASASATLLTTAGISDIRMAIVAWTGTTNATTGDPISAWNTAGTNPTLATDWAYCGTPTNLGVSSAAFGRYEVEAVSIPANARNLALFIWCDDTSTTQTTDYFIVNTPQLEPGAVATAFDWRPPHDTLQEVRRYVQPIALGAYAQAYSATAIVLSGTFNPPLRSAPTLALADSTIDIAIPTAGTTQTSSGSAIVAQTTSIYGWTCKIDGFSGLTAQDPIQITQASAVLLADVRI